MIICAELLAKLLREKEEAAFRGSKRNRHYGCPDNMEEEDHLYDLGHYEGLASAYKDARRLLEKYLIENQVE